jgi:hypothetical protein
MDVKVSETPLALHEGMEQDLRTRGALHPPPDKLPCRWHTPKDISPGLLKLKPDICLSTDYDRTNTPNISSSSSLRVLRLSEVALTNDLSNLRDALIVNPNLQEPSVNLNYATDAWTFYCREPDMFPRLVWPKMKDILSRPNETPGASGRPRLLHIVRTTDADLRHSFSNLNSKSTVSAFLNSVKGLRKLILLKRGEDFQDGPVHHATLRHSDSLDYLGAGLPHQLRAE